MLIRYHVISHPASDPMRRSRGIGYRITGFGSLFLRIPTTSLGHSSASLWFVLFLAAVLPMSFYSGVFSLPAFFSFICTCAVFSVPCSNIYYSLIFVFELCSLWSLPFSSLLYTTAPTSVRCETWMYAQSSLKISAGLLKISKPPASSV